MTAPRYEAVAARNKIQHALRVAGVPLTVSGGVYYGQCMQKMFEDVVAAGVQYILTVDFDSIFTADDVKRLLGIVAQEEKIDALAALQPMRGSGRVLGTDGSGGELTWTGYPLQMQSAHFGLTVIDVAKLRSVDKPWFAHYADSNGEWSKDCVDDDVHFWRQWAAAGNTVYCDPGVRLGHLEEMVSVFDANMQLRHMYLKDWEAMRASETEEAVAESAAGAQDDSERRSRQPVG